MQILAEIKRHAILVQCSPNAAGAIQVIVYLAWMVRQKKNPVYFMDIKNLNHPQDL